MLTLDLRQSLELTDDQFEKICQANQNLKFERTATGELIILSLTGGETGERNASLTGQLWLWNRQSKLGHTFDSSTGFRLPNGAIRSPDAAWISQERWQELTAQQRRKLVPLCPDFIVELCSPSDNLEDVQLKMQEFLENGIKLGWLIDLETKTVEIYRSNQEREILHHPTTLSEKDLLPGFSLDLADILAD